MLNLRKDLEELKGENIKLDASKGIRAKQNPKKPEFTAAKWGKGTVKEGEKAELSAQVKDIDGGNMVTFQVWNLVAEQFLPQNTEITFKKGVDDNYYKTNMAYRYEIENVIVNGQKYEPQVGSWFVPLKYIDKQKCKDSENYPQNFCNYMEFPSVTPIL